MDTLNLNMSADEFVETINNNAEELGTTKLNLGIRTPHSIVQAINEQKGENSISERTPGATSVIDGVEVKGLGAIYNEAPTPTGLPTIEVGKKYKFKFKTTLPEEFYVDYTDESHEEDFENLYNFLGQGVFINYDTIESLPEGDFGLSCLGDGSSIGPMIIANEEDGVKITQDVFNLKHSTGFVRDEDAGWYTCNALDEEPVYTPVTSPIEFTTNIISLFANVDDTPTPVDEYDCKDMNWLFESIEEIN